MTNIQKLKDMLDNLINGKSEQAQVVFHDYLKSKMNGVVGSEGTQPGQVQKNSEE
jgi:hypothetical protein